MLAVLLGLASAAAFGASDFLGGVASRRSAITAVAVTSHLVAVALTLGAAAVFVTGPVPLGGLAWGAGAGMANAVGIMFLYRGLARGRMAVVSPLVGVVAAAVPVTFGLASGERPAPVSLAGVAVALAAIVLVTSTAPRRHPPARRASFRGSDVADGLVAGLAYGAFFVLLGQAGADGPVWPIVGVQAATVAVLVPAALLSGRAVRPRRTDLAIVVAAGLLGAAGTAAYVLAAGHGLLSLVAVLAALSPAGTVLLARLLLDERWSRLQVVGLGCAAVGVAAIAAG